MFVVTVAHRHIDLDKRVFEGAALVLEAHTAENVYKGLCGFHLVFNEYDTGDETTGFRLPGYPNHDIPILFVDVAIDPITYQASLDLLQDGGHLGDKYLVNGKISRSST